MNNNPGRLSIVFLLLIIASCKKEKVAQFITVIDYSFKQPFDSIQGAKRQGWVFINNSRPLGSRTWFQGNPTIFTGAVTSFSGADYIGVNSGSCASSVAPKTSTISNWLISPATLMKNGDVISFYTRCASFPAKFPDRLEVRISSTNSTDVGVDSFSVGDFSFLALTINPTLDAKGYPGNWTKYNDTIKNIAIPKMARFAFRYYVTEAGSGGKNSDYIGIDESEFKSN